MFSGRLSSVSRRKAQVIVERLGGLVADDITSRTTMLVMAAEPAAPGSGPGTSRDEAEKTAKLKRAERVNADRAGRVSILDEADFCRLAGLPSPAAIAQCAYGLREVRSLYPSVREDHLRYLAKWGLVGPGVRTNSETYVGFSDLLVIKQVAAQLEQGVAFRTVVRTLIAAHEGQLAFDFRPGRSGTQPAKVVTLATAVRPKPAVAPHAIGEIPAPSSVAAHHFLEGSALDDGDLQKQVRAESAYRLALSIDPTMVAALVNLANIHYARDELIEAQALYERAIRLEPDCFEAHFNLGNIHHDLGRYEDAEGCYREALGLSPTYAEAHFYLAVTLEKRGRSQDAKPHWRLYRQLAPDGEWVELAREFSE